MLCYSFVEFVLVYDHDIGHFLSRESSGSSIPELNIVKDLQESSHALVYQQLVNGSFEDTLVGLLNP